MANAIGATIWKLAADTLLNLENENFETDTQAQRVDILEEIICYLAHYCDRRVYSRAAEGERVQFVSSLAGDLARMLEDSRFDVQGAGEYRREFIDKFNRRSAEYAGYSFSEEEGAGFAMRCRLGDRVQAVMGERDRRWIPDFIVSRAAPDMEKALDGTLKGLVIFESEQAAD